MIAARRERWHQVIQHRVSQHSQGPRQGRMPGWRRIVTAVVVGLVTAATTTMAIASQASAGSPPPNTVAGVPATSSKVTVPGRGEFSHLKITVSQTRDIVNQAIGISWTGGAPTGFQPGYSTNFLQIMECWGNPVTDTRTLADKDNYVKANPGPPREQCEYGAAQDQGPLSGGSSGAGGIQGAGDGFSWSRYIIRGDPPPAPTAENDDNLYQAPPEVPFQPAPQNGENAPVIPTEKDKNWVWQNPYFDITTSNEIPYSATWQDGTGSAVLHADTGLEAPGLGCGDPVANGSSTPRDCWLVIVPRGATDINGKSLLGDLSLGSPLTSVNWQNRIAIPLHYRLDSTPCPIGANEHATQGSELITGAMTSWQSKLCASNTTILGYNQLSDDLTRQQLTGAAGSGELGFVSRPVDPSTVPAGQQIVYAPVTLSGVTIGVQIDYTTKQNETSNGGGPPVRQVNLTPRLVAKLLTDSYQGANTFRLGGTGGIAGGGTPPASDYSWLAKNPLSLFADPEFQKYNPQLSGLVADPPGIVGGNVMVELTGSDAAYELWSWILADPSAKAFLNGQPDPWGMTVDPYFSASSTVNPAHVGLSLPASTYPSPDPWCGYIGAYGHAAGQPPVCMLDYRPYTGSMAGAALDVLGNNPLQKLDWELDSKPFHYKSDYTIGVPGHRYMMGVTTTDSADRYGILDASLQNAAGKFVAPDTAGLLAGEAAMKPSGVPGVLAPNFASTSRSAYPLAMLTYAAVPLGTVAKVAKAAKADCQSYTALLDYASGPGQVPGVALGSLPPGYAPLPAALRAQTTAAAATVATCGQSTPPSGNPGPGHHPGHGGTPSGPGSPSGPGATANPTAGAPGSTGPSSTGSGTVPSGGPANVQQGLQLAGGTTPANPPVYGYALPVGAAAGLIATGAALLISRRRLGALRLLPALRLPQLPQSPRQSRLPRSPRPWRPWRGSP
jgi:hypothetical protein